MGSSRSETYICLSENKALYNYKAECRPNHPTKLYLSYLTGKILKGFDEGLLTEMMFIDL